MNTTEKLLFSLAVSFAICTSTAQAVLVTGMSSTAPTTDVVISQTAGANSTPFRWNRPAGTDRNPRDTGQSFLPSSSFTLDKITVNISSLASSAYDSQNMTLEVFTLTDGGDYTPDSTVVTESGSLPSNMKSSFDSGSTYLTLDIPDVVLSAGQQYGFLLMHDAQQSIGDNMLLAAQANSAYTDGIGITREQRGTGGDNYKEMTVWTGSSQPADLEFYLQETSGGPPPPPPNTLKHHYTFDTDATDSAGSTDGTFVGDAAVNSGGNPVGGGYLELDGNGDWVSFGANPLTPSGSTVSNEVTISGWVRFDGATKVNPYDTRNLGSFYAESSGGNVRYNFDGRADQNNGQMALDQYPASGGSWFGASNTGFTDFDWHHIAYVQSTTSPNRQFFIDGNQFATSGTPEQYTGGTSFDVAIGNRTGANGKEPDVGLDDMAFWHEALTGGEMKGLCDVALEPTLGYNAGEFDLLKQVHDQVLPSATIGALEWIRATGLTGGAGLSGSGSAFTLVLDEARDTGVVSRAAAADVIPEPCAFLIWALGLLGLAWHGRRRRRKA